MLLCTLKAALLYKYFPEDIQYKRKYQRMMKQKKKMEMQGEENTDQEAHENDERTDDKIETMQI